MTCTHSSYSCGQLSNAKGEMSGEFSDVARAACRASYFSIKSSSKGGRDDMSSPAVYVAVSLRSAKRCVNLERSVASPSGVSDLNIVFFRSSVASS